MKWDFEIDFRNFDEKIASEMKKRIVDAIFTRFDISFDVNIERCERFDEIICIDVATEIANEINRFLICSESVTNLNIENFVVVVDEIDFEIVDEVAELLF